MPGSILINDGRRSASPDRRVTFGNIERYDIMTSNEIKNNMNQRRGMQEQNNANYPMTRLDNRIRKAIQLGFTPMIGDTVTYGEITDFLLEFGVIPTQRICTERQITAIVQASFPKVITKPSAKYSVVFVNLENRSDDVVKEELVRVTTEPIIDPASREAKAWIQEADEDEYESDENEDEELTRIENQKKEKEKQEENIQNGSHKNNKDSSSSESLSSPSTPTNQRIKTSTPPLRNGIHKPVAESIASTAERGVDISFERSPRFADNLNNQKSMSKSTGDLLRGSSIKRNSSFSKNINRSTSVTNMAKKFENSEDEVDGADINKSTSNLQRKRSFTRSTDRSFVGSIRDRFRSSLKGKKPNTNNEKEEIDESPLSSERKAKSNKNEEQKIKEESVKIAEEKDNTTAVKRGNSKTSFRNDSIDNGKNSVTKIGANNDIRISVNKTTNNRFGGSTNDVRNASRNKTQEETTPVNKSLNISSNDVKGNYRANSMKQSTVNQDEEVRASFRTNGTKQSTNRNSFDYNNNNNNNNNNGTGVTNGRNQNENKSNFVRATGYRNTTQTNEPRASIRRNNNNNNNNNNNDVRASIRKSNNDKSTTISKTTSLRVGANNQPTNNRTNSVRASLRDNPKKGTGIRRSNSRAKSIPRNQLLNNNNINQSNNSSAQSTPTVSRENSKTNLKIPIRRQLSSTKQTTNLESTQQEKDILRIATAFQQASDELCVAKDNVEQFMITIATDDIEPCTNNRLNVDDLYDHIRHRMIIAQQSIFEGYRSDIRVDMSQYFGLLFTALASNLSRVGCEIVTDSTTQQKVCYITHVKLVDYADDLRKMADDQLLAEDMQASYV